MLINLRHTMESGQPPHFTWNSENGRYWRMLGGRKWEIWQENGRVHCTHGFEKRTRELLRLDDDLKKIYRRLCTDAIMREAIAKFRGLRITRNDPWETLVCFILSQNANIPRIRRMVQSLMINGEIAPPKILARKNLAVCKLGYRCDYLQQSAELASRGTLKRIGRMPYEEARAALLQFPGVGPKVADCVLLFGFGFLEAFPVDVWVMRVMRRWGAKNERDAHEIAKDRWGKCAGYAQQYLYMLARTKGI